MVWSALAIIEPSGSQSKRTTLVRMASRQWPPGQRYDQISESSCRPRVWYGQVTARWQSRRHRSGFSTLTGVPSQIANRAAPFFSERNTSRHAPCDCRENRAQCTSLQDTDSPTYKTYLILLPTSSPGFSPDFSAPNSCISILSILRLSHAYQTSKNTAVTATIKHMPVLTHMPFR